MLSEDYNTITAYHYEAYRPPLHSIILGKCLLDRKFKHGLDIGCGTGKSTVALKRFCKRTLGIDPSTPMLEKTKSEEGIAYDHFDGKHLYFKENSFDIITLAGSWWYGKSQVLLDEICKVGAIDASVVLYDFEIIFTPIYDRLQLKLKPEINNYNHFIDFSDFNAKGFKLHSKVFEEIRFRVTAKELAHLICSEKEVFKLLQLDYDALNPFEKLIDMLIDIYANNSIELSAKTYCTSYYL